MSPRSSPEQTAERTGLSERIQSIRVSVDFYAEFHGKWQSDDEAKYNICSVFNDISHFRCLVTTHKLKFWIYLTDYDRPLTRPAVSTREGPRERRKSSLTWGPYLAKPRVSRMPLKLSNPFRVGSETGWVSNREYILKTPSTVGLI